MKHLINYSPILAMLVIALPSSAQKVIELDTTTITGNNELPKAMFVVPWQDKTRRDNTQQQLVIHNLYGDLFDPVMPNYIPDSKFPIPITEENAK